MSEQPGLRELYDRGMRCPGAVHRDYEIYLDEEEFVVYGVDWEEAGRVEADVIYSVEFEEFRGMVDDLIDEYESELLH